MTLALLSRSCRQFGRRALPQFRRIALARTFPPMMIHANTLSSLHFPDILEVEPLGDVPPVVEDVVFDDVVEEPERFQEDHVEIRVQTPNASSYSSVEVESNPFDQDYDQYSLHMSTFQAYNTTHEELPPELGLLEPDDVMNLQTVENYWEHHPDAYSEELPHVHTPLDEETESFTPDVEDV